MVMNEFDPREVPGQSNEEVSGINIQLFFCMEIFIVWLAIC